MVDVVFCYLIAGLVCTLCHVRCKDIWEDFQKEEYIGTGIITLLSVISWPIWVLAWIVYKLSREEKGRGQE